MYSDNNFLKSRDYGFPRARVLLYRKDMLCVLRRDLVTLDHDDVMSNPLMLVLKRLNKRTDRDLLYSLKMLVRTMECRDCRFIRWPLLYGVHAC